ncbi:MAG: hypothetical protein ABH816_04410 [Candidatus Levyibacteriota bacterium]
MLFIITALLTLFTIAVNGITAIPFSIGLLAVYAVFFRKSWVFFLALGLGLFLDLAMIRPLGYTSLILVIFAFVLFLYERKFETQTATFVFISTFLGSLIYLILFENNNILIQAFISAIFGVFAFYLVRKSKFKNQKF